MRVVFIILAFLGSLFANNVKIHRQNNNVASSIGFANITAHEYVWRENTKLSELEWGVKGVPFFKVYSSGIVLDSVILDGEIYFTFTDQNGKMVDDDWIDGIKGDRLPPDEQRDPHKHTHRSIHDDTQVNAFRGVDISAKTLPLEIFHTNFSIGAGYKYDYVQFSASNGEYHYQCDGGYPNGCSEVGTFSGKVIEYEQSFYAFYVGLYLSWYDLAGFNAGLSAKYSNIVYAEDFDNHLLRNTTFETMVDDTQFYTLKAYVSYDFTPKLAIFLDFDYTKYKAKISDVIISEYGKSSGIAKKGSSFDNTTAKASLGIVYYF